MTSSFKFIHTADLHIDSPLRGLRAKDEGMLRRVQEGTRTAFERIVTLAIEQEVAFVLIAGDLFDGDWKDMHTGKWTAGQFRRLQAAAVEVYYIRGNHDAESKVRQGIRWPENVHELSTSKPETIHLETLGAAIHGQGFAHRETLKDLAATYPAAVPGCFNIGMLHTSLTGFEGHDPYAPTTLDTLRGRGYDYWALGHIHIRTPEPLSLDPFIAYSGNPQGRHIKESGPKGCYVVEVEDGHLRTAEFHATDLLRWRQLEIPLAAEDDLDAAYDKTSLTLAEAHRDHEGRFSAFRLTYTGRTAAHTALSNPLRRGEILAQITDLADAIDEEIWLEKIELNTQPLATSKPQLSADLLGSLARRFEQTLASEEELKQLETLITPVIEKCTAAKARLDFGEETATLDDHLRRWTQEAEQLLIQELGDGNE